MSPNLTVIVTSRSALNLSIETEYRLQALAIPTEKDEYEDILNSPSVELFITKAKTADPALHSPKKIAEHCNDMPSA